MAALVARVAAAPRAVARPLVQLDVEELLNDPVIIVLPLQELDRRDELGDGGPEFQLPGSDKGEDNAEESCGHKEEYGEDNAHQDLGDDVRPHRLVQESILPVVNGDAPEH